MIDTLQIFNSGLTKKIVRRVRGVCRVGEVGRRALRVKHGSRRQDAVDGEQRRAVRRQQSGRTRLQLLRRVVHAVREMLHRHRRTPS